MYLNFKLLNRKGLSVYDFMFLTAAKQNKFEDLSEECETLAGLEINRYIEDGLVEYVSTSKHGKTPWHRLRTTSKANDLLSDLETPEVTEEDLKVFEWLAASYRASGKDVGNMKQTKKYIALFRAHSGIDRNKLVKLCSDFIDHPDESKWSFKLEFLFFKREHNNQRHFDLECSKLWQYYLKYKEYYDELFKKDEYNR